MILSELKQYIQINKRVSLRDLVMHFDVEADAIRGMLSKWIRKGKIQRIATHSECGTSCCKCDPTLTELYEWLEK